MSTKPERIQVLNSLELQIAKTNHRPSINQKIGGTLLGLVCSIEERSYAAWDSTGPVVSLSLGALTLSVGSGSVRLPIA